VFSDCARSSNSLIVASATITETAMGLRVEHVGHVLVCVGRVRGENFAVLGANVLLIVGDHSRAECLLLIYYVTINETVKL